MTTITTLMIIKTIGIFSALFLILLLALVYNKTINYKLKVIVIFASIFSLYYSYNAYQNVLGWPVEGVLPETMFFIAADIREPSKNYQGHIVIWIRENSKEDAVPKSYIFPYSRNMHENMAKLQQQAAETNSAVYVEKKDEQLTDKDNQLYSFKRNFDNFKPDFELVHPKHIPLPQK